jgi:hypothetical protein
MAAPRVGEQLVVQDPLEGPEQDSGQVALCAIQASSQSCIFFTNILNLSHEIGLRFQKKNIYFIFNLRLIFGGNLKNFSECIACQYMYVILFVKNGKEGGAGLHGGNLSVYWVQGRFL